MPSARVVRFGRAWVSVCSGLQAFAPSQPTRRLQRLTVAGRSPARSA